jgi:hypothetical protein
MVRRFARGAVDDEALPAPGLLAAALVGGAVPAGAAEGVALDPDLAGLERLADVLEGEGVARARVDGRHQRDEEGR